MKKYALFDIEQVAEVMAQEYVLYFNDEDGDYDFNIMFEKSDPIRQVRLQEEVQAKSRYFIRILENLKK